MKKNNVFFHLCTPVLISWNDFKNENEIAFIYFFIHLYTLSKIYIPSLFFLYFINKCVCTRSSLQKNSNSKVVSYTYMYIHSVDAAQISNCILYTHIDRWQRFNGALWWQIYDVGWMNSSTKATRTLEKIKWKSQFWVKLGRSNLKHGLPKGFFFFVVVKMKYKSEWGNIYGKVALSKYETR